MKVANLLAKAAQLPVWLDGHRRARLAFWIECLLPVGGIAVWTLPSLVHIDDAYVYLWGSVVLLELDKIQ